MTDDTDLGLLLRDPFPASDPPAAVVPTDARRTRRRRPQVWTAILVVVVLAAAAGGVWAATGSSAATYRLAPAAMGDVDQTLNSYGTIVPIHQAAVAFPVSGTIATVPVTLGQQVTAGQTLATIEVSSLQAKLDAAESTLATAQAKLVTDTAAEASGTSVSTTSGTSASLSPASAGQATVIAAHPSASPTTSTTTSTTKSGSSAQNAVTAAQSKLLADQRAVDGLTNVVAADLRTGTTTCAALITQLHNLGAPPTTSTPGAPRRPRRPPRPARPAHPYRIRRLAPTS